MTKKNYFQTAVLTILLLSFSSCTSTKRLELKDFQSTVIEGPCQFGRLPFNKDPELPQSGYIPTVICEAKSQALMSLGQEWIDYDWAEVYYDGKDRFVAILDWAIEGGFAVVPVLESLDRGKTWHGISKIEKPHFSARITKLSFDENGNGEVEIEWEPKDIVLSKLYSTDNGKTWGANKQKVN
ncbi:MAG: hypothetical protein R3A80_06400 [Bdellovibrionota bacterium]